MSRISKSNSRLFYSGFAIGVLAVLGVTFLMNQQELLTSNPVGMAVACLVAGLVSGVWHRY